MKNQEFEEKIWNEVLIDCNDDYDQNQYFMQLLFARWTTFGQIE